MQPDRVHRRLYTDDAVFAREMNHIFAATWVYLAHESEIPNPNDFKLAWIGLREVIVATPPSVDGEATALLLARELARAGVSISRIASGVPHGGDLEFADQITLGRAIDGRRSMGG